MGQYKAISTPATLKKVERARALKAEGLSDEAIASAMNLSVSRIKELIRGVNWDSRA